MMQISALDIRRNRVVNVSDGDTLGRVSDIVIDPNTNEVKLLAVKENRASVQTKYVSFPDIKTISKDNILVENSDKLKLETQLPHELAALVSPASSTFLSKSKIFSNDGKDLGFIKDITFDTSNGRVTEVKVSKGIKELFSMKSKFKIKNIQTVTDTEAVVEVEKNSNSNTGEKQEATKGQDKDQNKDPSAEQNKQQRDPEQSSKPEASKGTSNSKNIEFPKYASSEGTIHLK